MKKYSKLKFDQQKKCHFLFPLGEKFLIMPLGNLLSLTRINLPDSRDPSCCKTLKRQLGCPGHQYSPAIPLVNHVEVLQGGGDVMWAHACSSADRLDADVPLMVVVEIF